MAKRENARQRFEETGIAGQQTENKRHPHRRRSSETYYSSQETPALSNKDTPAVRGEVVIPGVEQAPDTTTSLENALTKLSVGETTVPKHEELAPVQTTTPEPPQRTDPMPETPIPLLLMPITNLWTRSSSKLHPKPRTNRFLSSTQPIPKPLKTS